jgi:hypothetical protein
MKMIMIRIINNIKDAIFPSPSPLSLSLFSSPNLLLYISQYFCTGNGSNELAAIILGLTMAVGRSLASSAITCSPSDLE